MRIGFELCRRALALLWALNIAPAHADELAPPTVQADFKASIGVLNGEAREYVYDADTGKTVSRLDWGFDNVAMFNAALSFRPAGWLELQVKGSTNLSAHASMSDHDFDIPECPDNGNGGTFCKSYHPATRLMGAYMLDVAARLRGLKSGTTELSPVVGYKLDYFSWRGINGTSNYAGDFADGVGISYEQWWKTPYIGLAMSGHAGNLDFSGRAIFSDWGEGKDRDHHHSRSLLFHEQFEDVRMFGIDVGVRYPLTDRVGITLDYSFEAWKLSKGPAQITDLASGSTEREPGDAAGASSRTQMIALGVSIDLTPATLSAREPVETPRRRWPLVGRVCRRLGRGRLAWCKLER